LIPTLALIGLLAATRPTTGADVLQNVPRDALGFVVIRNLSASDQKVQRLISNLQTEAIGPLAFLRLTAGIGAGLDTAGDFLLAVLPSKNGAEKPEFCVWLPVSDYDRLLSSLSGRPAPGIMTISIAGEDLLIARDEDWALIMDPDQNARMEQVLADKASAPELIANWRAWSATNDISVVALTGGVRAILKMASPKSSIERHARLRLEDSPDDPFDRTDSIEEADSNATDDNSVADMIASGLQRSLGRVLALSPRFGELANDLQSLGCGINCDDDGNARIGFRATCPTDSAVSQLADENLSRLGLPYRIHDGEEFVVHAAGHWPPALTTLAASSYLRLIVDELRRHERIQLAEKTVSRFLQAVEQAAAEVASISVLTLAGEKQDGVYTNGFLVVRVPSADKFVDLANEAMRLWNQMNRDAEGGPRLVFDVAELPIGDRQVVQYSLDLAASDGAPAIPEIRQAMEKLFGPGGKFTLLLAKIDGHTALMAAATREQVATVMERLDRQQAIDWNAPPLAAANRLLVDESQWRAFFSPHGYTTWSSREMDAIVSAPVVGGPLVRPFPQTPPIGAAGGVKGGELWIDVAVPVQTIQGVGTYLKKGRRGRR
jgi:hypothetical protein